MNAPRPPKSLPLRTSGATVARTSHRPARRGHDVESPYATVEETRALVAGSLAARSARLAADDMVSTDEAALLAGTSRVTINAWIGKGRCIGLTQTKRGFRVPAWQFEPRMWDALPGLSSALGTTDGWALLSFLETPLGALQGITPREAIERGKAERVLALAAHEGH